MELCSSYGFKTSTPTRRSQNSPGYGRQIDYNGPGKLRPNTKSSGSTVSWLVPDVFAVGCCQFLTTGSTRELESSPLFTSVKQSFSERFTDSPTALPTPEPLASPTPTPMLPRRRESRHPQPNLPDPNLRIKQFWLCDFSELAWAWSCLCLSDHGQVSPLTTIERCTVCGGMGPVH
ncbi:hypothetical protein FA13DRAFT_1736242 [Coprinellus micaceus]|uniref:Uncharacterized protein n=1 Tax=Coprinellus micaceus TaxID=71717 RepID=A0A4Y7T193_COPMI|nr:hypothetical protein FA13DRAFT_1736242 [Coprinellus micaceus]